MLTGEESMPKKINILEELNRVAQILPIPIAWLDINSVILGVNEVGLKAIDSTREDYVGKSLYEIYPYEMADHIKHHDEKVIASGKILGQEESARDILTGEIKYFYSLKAPLRDETGKIIGLVVSALDISDRHKLEEELKESKTELKELYNKLEEKHTEFEEELKDHLNTKNRTSKIKTNKQ